MFSVDSPVRVSLRVRMRKLSSDIARDKVHISRFVDGVYLLVRGGSLSRNSTKCALHILAAR